MFIQNSYRFGAVADSNFTFTVKTDNSGTSTSTQFKLPLVSSFNGVTANVDWGDGTTNSITAFDQSEVTHTYSATGTYQIKITNALRGFQFNNGGDKLKILSISNWGVFNLNLNSSFNGCSNLSITANDSPIISTTSTAIMFLNCTSLTTLNASGWNVSSVTNMLNMFEGCTSLTTLNASSWNVGNVTNMLRVFNGCSSLITLDVSSWSVSNVTDISSMFLNCVSLITLDVSSWSVSNVTNMSNTFNNCTSLTTLDVSSWNIGSVSNMSSMFEDCSSLTTLNVSSWNVSNVTNMSSMFNECLLLTTLDSSSWNVSSVTNMASMFNNCDSFNYSLANWNINNVVNFNDFMSLSTGLSISNYDLTLIGWEATLQAEFPSGVGYTPVINIDFEGVNYTEGGTAETSRQSLVTNFGWTITDGGAIASSLPLSDIISQYKFENNVNDFVGSNNGTATSIAYTAGLVGQTGVFNGSTSKVTLSPIAITTGISLSLLVKNNVNIPPSSSEAGFININTSNFDTHYPWTNGLSYINILTDSRKTITSTISDKSVWHHLIVTADTSGNVWKMYENGYLIHTSTVGTLTNIADTKIGESKTGIYNFKGDMDCVTVWDKVLTGGEALLLSTEELAGTDINP